MIRRDHECIIPALWSRNNRQQDSEKLHGSKRKGVEPICQTEKPNWLVASSILIIVLYVLLFEYSSIVDRVVWNPSDIIIFVFLWGVMTCHTTIHKLHITKMSTAPLDTHYKISRLGASSDVIVIKFCSKLSSIDCYIIILNT